MKIIETTKLYNDWLAGLRDANAVDRIQRRIRRAEFGNFGDHKGVGGGVIEMRIDYGPGYRVYLTERHRGELIILLAGGTKKKQNADILRAILLAKAY